MTTGAANLNAAALLRSDGSRVATRLTTQVLYRRVPIDAPVTVAKSGTTADADIALSSVTYGQSSVSVAPRAAGTGSLYAAPSIESDAGVVRWILIDDRTGDLWQVYLNPNQMSAPPANRSFRRGTTLRNSDRMASFESPTTIQPWSFEGVLLTEEHYLKLEEWSLKQGTIRVRDHLGRTFKVIIESFVPHEVPGKGPDYWKMTYTVNTQFLRRIQ